MAALLIGGSVGTVIGLFRMAVSWAVQSSPGPGIFRRLSVFAVPLAGLLIVWLYRSCGLSTDPGTDYMLLSVRTNPGVQPRMVPLIAVSTVLTHLCGGSAGRIGAALQMGGSISGALGHWARMDRERLPHYDHVRHGGRFFGAVWHAPDGCCLCHGGDQRRGDVPMRAFFPCLLSAFCSFLVTSAMGIFRLMPTRLRRCRLCRWLPSDRLALMGAACALAARLFCSGLRFARYAYGRLLPNP